MKSGREKSGTAAIERIVPIRDEHIRGFHAALDSVARERRFLAYTEAPPFDEVRAFVRALGARGFPQFVALAGRRVVGWCDVAPLERPGPRRAGVLGLGVVADFRRRGIGRRLLEATLAQARRIGLARVELRVRARNRPAIALYDSLGFTVEGIERGALGIDTTREDLVLMALRMPGR